MTTDIDSIFKEDDHKGYGSLEEYPVNDTPDDYLREIIQQHAQKGSKILDLGCGAGNNLLPLASLGYELYGVDVLTSHLNTLKARITKQNESNINLMLWDVFGNSNLPWHGLKKNISVIYATYLFGHCSNEIMEKTVKAYSQYLKEDGIFILTNMQNFSLPLTEWEKRTSPYNLGIISRNDATVDAMMQGFEKLSDSRQFKKGEMKFWSLPEESHSWLIYRKKEHSQFSPQAR